jgi:Ca2+-binding RTX toxin-like protein
MLSLKSANRFARLAVVCLALAGGCTAGIDRDEGEVGVTTAELSVADCPAGYNIIQGDDNANILVGTAGADCIVGNGGNDTISGLGGTDFLIGGLGNDALFGGDGNDTMHGEEGTDRLEGQNDDDTMFGGIATDKLYGGGGNDWIDAGSSNDIVEGNAGNDVLYGGIGIDTIRGGDGEDRLFGGPSNDFLFGDAGNDVLHGGDDNDDCRGGDGNDVITGGNDSDLLSGEAGDDFIADSTGTNTIDGGANSDSCTGTSCELASPTVSGCTLATQCGLSQTCAADVGMCVPCGAAGGSGCNSSDNCPSDPTKSEPGICGCGVSDMDSDGDGTADCNDACAIDPNKTAAGICGCGTSDGDSDGDGPIDCSEACPSDPNKTAAGICGCGVADTDASGNGIADCLDGPSAALTVASCPAGYNIIQGDANANTINGTAGNDCILGFGGNDTINGLGGSDFLIGGAGNDKIFGGDGNDTMYGEGGADRLEGQNDDDRMYGGIAVDKLYGGSGNDWMHAGTSNDDMDGNAGNDVAYGGDGFDNVRGGDGEDRLFGDAGDDDLFGNAGNDVLSGGANNDDCLGGDGNDVITGGTGNDVLSGEAGNDFIADTSGTNTIDGGPNTDSCTGTNCESASPTVSGCTLTAQCAAAQTCSADVGMCLPCGAAGGIGCNATDNCPSDPNKLEPGLCGCGVPETTPCAGAFVPVLLSETDKSDNVHLSDDSLELRISNTQNDGGVRSDVSVASGSGVWYFEMSQIGITGNGFFGAGVGTATAPLDQTIGSTTQSVGMTGGGIVWFDGNFIGNFGHADTIGFVVDYRGVNPIVHIIGYDFGESAQRHKRTLPVTTPVFAMFTGQAAHHGEIARFNFGSDTENHPFVHDVVAVLNAAGETSAAGALVRGFGQTRALTHSNPPVLTVDPDLSIAVNTPLTLHASATDTEDGSLTSEILWENTAESYYVRQRGSGNTFSFTPTEIGKYPIRVLVKDSADVVTEDEIMVTVTGTLPQLDPVRLVINSDSGAGISLSPDGLSAHYTLNEKMAVRANQGNYGRFWYFEARRLSDASFSLGTGLVVSKGSLNPLSFFTTQPSLEVNFLGSAWRDLVFQANTPSPAGYYGFAVDYRGEHPIVYVIVDNAVIYTVTLDHVWVPLYPMLYGNSAPGPYDNVINFGATAFQFNPTTALTNAGVSTTGFQPYWGDSNAP